MTGADALFISDLHLSPAQPEITAAFEAFLSGPAQRTRTLYILGDLFDYWAGDDDLDDSFNTHITAALAHLSASGTAVFLLPGNRDFLVGERFATAAGLQLLAEPTVHSVCGEKILLMHGDTLCTDDRDYQAFREHVRTLAWRANFLAKPLTERKAMITQLRARSESEKQVKDPALMDANPAAITASFRQSGLSLLVHGHVHRQGHHTHTVDNRACQRWVLGDWHGQQTSVLARDATGWHFL
jgi:UDP-2,3-diacylglucosamine hydrolase